MKNKTVKLILLLSLCAGLVTGCSGPDLSKLPIIGDKFSSSDDATDDTGTAGESTGADVTLGELETGTSLTADDGNTMAQAYCGTIPTKTMYSDADGNMYTEITVEEGYHEGSLLYQLDDGTYTLTYSYTGVGSAGTVGTPESTDVEVEETTEEETVQEEPTYTYSITQICDVDWYTEEDPASITSDGYQEDYLYQISGDLYNSLLLSRDTENDEYNNEEQLYDNDGNLTSEYLEESVSVSYINDLSCLIYSYESTHNYEPVGSFYFLEFPSEDVLSAAVKETDSDFEFVADDTHVSDNEKLICQAMIDTNVEAISDEPITNEQSNLTSDSETGSLGDLASLTSAADANSYAAKHPELFKWKTIEEKYSRWDWRITDSTSLTSTITLGDGTTIPTQQQNQDGYAYTFGNGAAGTTTVTGSETSETETENTDIVTLQGSNSEMVVQTYKAKSFNVNGSLATSSVVPVSKYTDNYIVKYYDKTAFQSLMKNNYYTEEDVIGTDYKIYEETTSTSMNGDTIHNVVIEYTDSTGATQTRPYMSYINTGDDYYVCVPDSGESIEYEFSTTLEEIMKYCTGE